MNNAWHSFIKKKKKRMTLIVGNKIMINKIL